MKVKNSTMQAFPFIEPQEDDNIKAYHPGMTMRDEFAKAAMQGLISCADWRLDAGEDVGMDASDYTAQAAYMMADAMMKARK
jgi:hypothetical protein